MIKNEYRMNLHVLTVHMPWESRKFHCLLCTKRYMKQK